MLKPIKKKKKPLSHPSRLDDWPLHAPRFVPPFPQQQLPPSLYPLLVSKEGALLRRLQLRYQKYQEKVRGLLNKGDARVELDDREVKASSVALALAVTMQTRQLEEEKKKKRDMDSTAAKPLKQPSRGSFFSLSESKCPFETWSHNDLYQTKDWNKRYDEGHNGQTQDTDELMDLPLLKEQTLLVQNEHLLDTKIQNHPAHLMHLDSNNKLERDGRQLGFVNMMDISWLLASIAQRCAAITGSSAPEKSSKLQPRWKWIFQLADVRLAVVDLLFCCRAGVGVNLLGRPPSSMETHYQHLIQRVKDTMADKQDGTELTIVDCERLMRIFNSLKSDMVMPAVRCLGWLLTKTWRLLFHGLHVNLESLHHVRRVLETLEGDVSVVFAPTHKSHMDYLIISYLCFAYGIPLPRIAAGNNLDLPLVGSFLRANGSFFIRRSFQDDQLYKEVLEQYVHELLRDGNPVEVFIEGGRSRHGRVCKPRLGFMSMFLDYVKNTTRSASEEEATDSQESTKKTILVVPISLDYDKVYEVDGYVNQLLGKPKEKESLIVLLRSVWDLFFLRLGHAYIRFGKPVPLTEASSLQESSELVAERMQTSGTITSTAIASALLMWKRAFVTKNMLKARTSWLVEELEQRGATVAHMDVENIAAHALSILKVDTKPNGVVLSQLQYPVRALELGFYRNHLLHIFLPEMAVFGALDTALRERRRCDKSYLTLREVNIRDVQQQAQEIWQFLRHICRHEAIDIKAHVTQYLTEAAVCDIDKYSGKVTVDMDKWNRSKLTSFVLSLNWSFMDSLWLTTQGLWCLLPAGDDDNSEHTERDVVQRVQVLAKELFLRQQLFHAEALCSESIKQSLEFVVESGIVRIERSRDGKSRVMRLCPMFADPVRVLENLTCKVNTRRKPHEFLWREDELPHNLTRKEALEIISSAQDSQRVYAKWMAGPITSSTMDIQ
uniref:Phospholipid/glycerol acyltransferase domain-containing protein n=1 Tax=Hyaloperonospora arabidopsidis (strain Emoy2) TaxID=559515 RepID=M4BKD2_HYAAE